MASDATDEPRPVLSYVSTAPEPAGAAQWVHSRDGVRLVVPPPTAWRRMAGPAFRLAVTTPIILASVIGLVMAIDNAVRRRNVAELVSVMCSVIIGLAVTGLWAGALTRLIRIARRGRQPFMLHVTNDALHVTPAADDPLDAARWAISDVVDARMDEMSWSLLVRIVRLELTLRDGDAIVTYVPWPNKGPLLQFETELRGLLGLAPTTPDMARVITG